MAKRKRSDSEEKEAPVSKPTASSDSETSDSDDEVSAAILVVRILSRLLDYHDVKAHRYVFVAVTGIPMLK